MDSLENFELRHAEYRTGRVSPFRCSINLQLDPEDSGYHRGRLSFEFDTREFSWEYTVDDKDQRHLHLVFSGRRNELALPFFNFVKSTNGKNSVWLQSSWFMSKEWVDRWYESDEPWPFWQPHPSYDNRDKLRDMAMFPVRTGNHEFKLHTPVNNAVERWRDRVIVSGENAKREYRHEITLEGNHAGGRWR